MHNQMLSQISVGMQFLICTLAVWRLTHLFVLEDGPWDFVFRLRKLLGNSIFGRAMDCFHCFSIWVAVPFACIIFNNWLSMLLGWLSLSGAACLLEQLTCLQNNDNENNPD